MLCSLSLIIFIFTHLPKGVLYAIYANINYRQSAMKRIMHMFFMQNCCIITLCVFFFSCVVVVLVVAVQSHACAMHTEERWTHSYMLCARFDGGERIPNELAFALRASLDGRKITAPPCSKFMKQVFHIAGPWIAAECYPNKKNCPTKKIVKKISGVADSTNERRTITVIYISRIQCFRPRQSTGMLRSTTTIQ